MTVLNKLLVCSTPSLETIITVNKLIIPPYTHTHTSTPLSSTLPPFSYLFQFFVQYLDLNTTTACVLFPITGMDQRKLSFSRSSLLDSHITLLVKELTVWICENIPGERLGVQREQGEPLMETVPEHTRRPAFSQDFKWRQNL